MAQSRVRRADDCWQMEASKSKKKAIRWARGTRMRGANERRAATWLPGGWKSGVISAWLSVHIHTHRCPKVGWCNATTSAWGQVVFHPRGVEGSQGTELNEITADGRHQKLLYLQTERAIIGGQQPELPAGGASPHDLCLLAYLIFIDFIQSVYEKCDITDDFIVCDCLNLMFFDQFLLSQQLQRWSVNSEYNDNSLLLLNFMLLLLDDF